MDDREALAELALDYLRAIAQSAEAEMGREPQRLQRSVWMVSTSPGGGRSSSYFERTTFNRREVDSFCQRKMREGIGDREKLTDTLAKLGMPRNEIHQVALLPLVRNWLKLPDPFAFKEDAISGVLECFVDFAISGVVHTNSRQVLSGLSLDSGSVVLEEGIAIRPISEEELWRIGDQDRLADFLGLSRGAMPSAD